MKTIALVLFVFLSLVSANSFAEDKSDRGAFYEMNSIVLTITERSLKLIDRADNGEHALKILKGGIPAISIKEAVAKMQASHGLFQKRAITFNPASNLLIEFEGRVANLIISHIARGRDGNYLALSVPDIYFSENMPVSIGGQEKIIKQLNISTDPSAGLLLQSRFSWSLLSDYWWFFQNKMDYDRKFKVQGLINYAEVKSEKGEIERLELVIMIIKINALP
ncbi:MAG: hypothetical protein Q7S81_02185 [bacterium]|nr:hypothetical protein [bacterium]